MIVPRHALLSPEGLSWLARVVGSAPLTDIQRQILASMRRGQMWTNSFVRQEFAPIDSAEARSFLQGLVARRFAVATGSRGGTMYGLAPDLDDETVRTAPTVEIVEDRQEPQDLFDVLADSVREEISALASNAPALWEALVEPRSKEELV